MKFGSGTIRMKWRDFPAILWGLLRWSSPIVVADTKILEIKLFPSFQFHVDEHTSHNSWSQIFFPNTFLCICICIVLSSLTHTGHRSRRSTLLAYLTPNWAINFTRPCECCASSTEWCRMASLLRHQRARRRQRRSWWHRSSIMSRNTPFITTWHMRFVIRNIRHIRFFRTPIRHSSAIFMILIWFWVSSRERERW